MSDQLRRLLEALSDPAAPVPGQPPGSAYDIPIELNEAWRQFVRTWSTDQDDSGLQLASELQVGGRISIVVALETLLGLWKPQSSPLPVMLVDENGQPISDTNPLPVSGGGASIVREAVTVNLSIPAGNIGGNGRVEGPVNNFAVPPGGISWRISTIDVSSGNTALPTTQPLTIVVWSSATGQGGWRERVSFGVFQPPTAPPTQAATDRSLSWASHGRYSYDTAANESAGADVRIASFDLNCLWNDDAFWKATLKGAANVVIPGISIELNMEYQAATSMDDLLKRARIASKRRQRRTGPKPLPKSAARAGKRRATDDRDPEE